MNLQRVKRQRGGRTFTIYASYANLVEVLGDPKNVNRYTEKIDVQWDVKDVDTGQTLSVWNYKNGPNYLGENGTPPEEIAKWSAGGDAKIAKELGLKIELLCCN